VGHFVFHPQRRELSLHGNSVKLTAIEARLLALFCHSESGHIERATALRRIWNDDAQLHGRSLNVYVSKLRQYLSGDPRIEILNVHGEGYQLVVK
jgi:DNA-binding response OmpR family regulator